ncbi:hypothetical protein L1887_63579 [Cichorium endivia]|nr:hypothetical protein L1887_63579 [Cichorium endivia]
MVVTGDGEFRDRFRRGSLRNGYHIQGRQQARKLPNPDTGVQSKSLNEDPLEGKSGAQQPRCATGLLVPSVGDALLALTGRGRASGAVTLKKLECSKQAYALTPLAPYEKSKFLGSGGSMVARLKLKGIDGRAPPGVEPAA